MRRSTRMVGAVVAAALLAPSCGSEAPPAGGGGDSTPVAARDSAPDSASAEPAPDVLPPLLVDGVVGDEALDAVLTADGDIDAAVVATFGAEFAALPPEQQEAVAADLSLRAELELANLSGLAAAAGDAAATGAGLIGASAQVRDRIVEAADDVAADAATADDVASEPQGFRRAASPTANAPVADGGGVAVVGLFLGFMALSLMSSVTTEASNRMEAGDSDVSEREGTVVGATVDEVDVELTYKGKQDGVDVEFLTGAAIHPCPEPDGTFTIDAVIDVKASKGGVGQNARMQLKIDGTVGDDAEIASKNIDNNVQWSDFAGGKGQFLDFTMSGPGGVERVTENRSGGTVTESFAKLAVVLGAFIGLMVATKLLDAAEKAWKSGRCVKLNVTPSAGPDGLTPSQVVSVLAEPRSKVDGTPTGGNVTATLSTGGASVEPDGSPVPADADSTYAAPDEQDKTGTVAYESRSRRGIGKAEITFSTMKPAAYQVVGGLDDWQVNQVVCDVTKPFTLTSPGVGTAEFSGGLTGTYTATGVFNFQYSGTYQITLSDGLGSAGSMIASSSGSTADQAGSGSENYALTPTTC